MVMMGFVLQQALEEFTVLMDVEMEMNQYGLERLQAHNLLCSIGICMMRID